MNKMIIALFTAVTLKTSAHTVQTSEDMVFNQISIFSVSVDIQNYQTVFDWNTKGELAVDYYTIEQRVNDTTVVELATVAALGFAKYELKYSASIDSIMTGVTQYRVKLTDAYGETTVTPWQIVHQENLSTIEYYYPEERLRGNLKPAINQKPTTTFVICDGYGNVLYTEGDTTSGQLLKSWIPKGQLYFKVVEEGAIKNGKVVE